MQNNPSNLNVDVRVNSPGDGGAVDQQNSATANADALATGAGSAAADASQLSPDNVNVAVRVGSAGDQGPVSQRNTAVASAGAGSGSGVQVALSSDASSSVTNDATLEQTLAQCPEGACTPGQMPTGETAASGRSGTANTTARAAQTDPSNVNVSVRVGSPGNDGPASQTSQASATGKSASATTTGADNLNVAVVIPGGGPVIGPSGSDPWTWTWLWNGSAVPPGPDAAATSSSDWNWNWSDGPAAATPTATAGHWIWTWTWTRSDGWTATFTSDVACSCTWIWTWTWNWDTPPPSMPTGPATAPSAPQAAQVTQSNVASATAEASSSSSTTQTSTLSTQTVQGDSSIEQSIQIAQVAQASANALQVDVSNFSFVGAGELASLSQLNGAAANASAGTALVAGQAVVQSQSGGVDGVVQLAQVSQTLASQQIAQASASAQQSATRNASRVWAQAPTAAPIGAIIQSNRAEATAVALDRAAVQQIAFQNQIGAGQEQTAQASQSFSSSQSATAAASSSQIRIANLSDVLIPAGGISNPALVQSNDLSTSAIATNTGRGGQVVIQAAQGEFVEWHETAAQEGAVRQAGDAGSGLVAVDRTNVAGWRGLVAAPSSPPGSAPAAAAATAAGQPLLVAGPVVFGAPRRFFSRSAAAPRMKQAMLGTQPLRAAGKTSRVPGRPPAVGGSNSVPRPAPSALVAAPLAMLALGADTSGRSSGRPRSSNDPSPLCPPSCGNGTLFGLAFAGAGGASLGSFAATLTPFRVFTAPGAGWLYSEAPDLGRPVDTAPIERPG